MRNLILLTTLLLLFTHAILAQCPTSDVIITTQQEVDDFTTNYSGCNYFSVEIQFIGPDITDLSPLADQIWETSEPITISGTSITNTTGIDMLLNIAPNLIIDDNDNLLNLDQFMYYDGPVEILNNDLISSISGFTDGADMGTVRIVNNAALTSIDGFGMVDITGEFVWIKDNPSLQTIHGFQSLWDVASINILNNDALTTITGFGMAEFIGNINVNHNDNLTSMFSLNENSSFNILRINNNSSLLDIGELNMNANTMEIKDNASLQQISGLNNIYAGSLTISGNPALQSISGLTSLNNNNLIIENNALLNDISGLADADLSSSLSIENNPNLSICNITSVCDWLDDGNPVTISGNNAGCANVNEVLDACGLISCSLIIEAAADNLSICEGESANLSVTSIGEIGMVTYQWDTGQSGANLVVSPTVTTTYEVIGTDEFLCMDTSEITIVVNSPPSPMISGASAICAAGGSSVLDAGAGYTSYLWSTGATSQSITVTSAGLYAVEVIDANNCFGIAEFEVEEFPDPIVEIETTASEICVGGSATLEALPFAGTAPYTFAWDQGLGTGAIHTVSPTTNTTYTVIATDANGCSTSNIITLSVSTSGGMTVEIESNPSSLCVGESSDLTALVSGGTQNFNFAWDNGLGNSSTHTVSPMLSTSYTVVVTDAGNCIAEASINIQVDDLPNPIITGNNSICAGQFTTLDAGDGYSSYNWSTGESSQTITVSQAGIFSVDVEDGNSCIGTAEIEVTVNAGPDILISATEEFICEGQEVELEAIGINAASPFSVSWDNGLGNGPIQSVSPYQTTTYTATLIDANSCETSSQITLFVSGEMDLEIAAASTTLCYGESTNLSAVLSGGLSGYTYIWNNGLGNSATHEVSPTETTNYTLTVEDAYECTVSAVVTIEVIPELNPVINGNLVLCAGESSVLDAGEGYSTYVWNNGEDSQIIEVTEAGMYSVELIDENGCTASAEVEVVVNDELLPVIVGLSSICSGESTTLDAGIGFTNYMWSTGDTSQTIEVSTAGIYSVQVDNGATCSGDDSFELIVNQSPVATASSTGPYCDGSDIQLSVEAFQNYTWTGPNNFFSDVQNPILITAGTSAAGNYTVVVQDANGCSAESSIDVIVNPNPIPVAMNTGPYCVGDNIELTVDDAVSYAWTGPDGFSSNQQNPTINDAALINSGQYFVEVEDINGCTGEVDVNITVNENPVIEIVEIGDSLVAQVMNGEGPFTFLWSSGDTTQSIAFIFENHEVIVSDINGCTATALFIVTSTSDINTSEVAIYPNPVNDILVVESSEVNALKANILISNINGAKVLESQFIQDKEMINVSILAPGVYVVHILNAKGSLARKKFVKL